MMEVSRQEEIQQVGMRRPHLVILGAGASRAAFPNGERNGNRLPLMTDFASIVPVQEVFSEMGIPLESSNFESAYSEIASDPALAAHREKLERIIYDYFAALELPERPTIYDHLLLGLREKDVVATFNWDPFLIQAARRNTLLNGRQPFLCFLHGNVSAGYCHKDKVHGVRGARCSRCGKQFSPSRLLYPVAEKGYDQDPLIADNWRLLSQALEEAFMVTIFGYSAPLSDASAITLLRKAWGTPKKRSLEQFEIIDIRPEKELAKSWKSFIHTHHYEVHPDVRASWLFRHPRRTGEAYINQYLEAKFIEDNPIPETDSLEELWNWFEPLLKAEDIARETSRREG
jgi:hypothetical protein